MNQWPSHAMVFFLMWVAATGGVYHRARMHKKPFSRWELVQGLAAAVVTALFSRWIGLWP